MQRHLPSLGLSFPAFVSYRGIKCGSFHSIMPYCAALFLSNGRNVSETRFPLHVKCQTPQAVGDPSSPSVCSPGPGTHWPGTEAVCLEPSLVSAALFQGSIWQAWCCGMSEPSLATQMEGATQVSGSKDLQSSEEFSQAGCGQLEAIRPRGGRASLRSSKERGARPGLRGFHPKGTWIHQ